MYKLLAFLLAASFLHQISEQNGSQNTGNSAAKISSPSLIDSVPVPKAYELFNWGDSITATQGFKQAADIIRSYAPHYHDPMEKNMYHQVMMTFESYTGNTVGALQHEVLYNPSKPATAHSFPEVFTVRPARTVIQEKCRNKQVVMINEAHHRGQHRAFIRSLLNDFYQAGFRYLFVEAYFENQDPLLNQRGYPLLQTGTYTREAAFGQMLREALALGFTVGSYDNDTSDCDSPEPFFCPNQRERVAAENINNFLKKDSKAKLLVLAGYGHIIKKTDTGMITMAEQVKNLSGIEPFSIDLVGMTERITGEHENAHYKRILEKYPLQEPVILVNSATNEVFLRNYRPDQIDLQVVFPRTNYRNGYAGWLTEGYQKSYVVDLSGIALQKGDLLQVYVKQELESHGKGAVPFLQYPLASNKPQTVLLPERYHYQFVVDHGNRQTRLKK